MKVRLPLVGYIVLVFFVGVALLNSELAKNEREEDLNSFLYQQCQRDIYRDNIIIAALQDAKRRAETSLANNPIQRKFETEQIQEQIDRLKPKNKCENLVPGY